MAKLTGHDFVLPSHPAIKMLDEATPDSMKIMRPAEYQNLDTPMDFLGGDSGMQGTHKGTQPRKLKFLTE